jgi:hypothetical protein
VLAITQLFKETAKGTFVGLGRKLDLRNITVRFISGHIGLFMGSCTLKERPEIARWIAVQKHRSGRLAPYFGVSSPHWRNPLRRPVLGFVDGDCGQRQRRSFFTGLPKRNGAARLA